MKFLTTQMPGNLREFMPSSVNDTMIETFFGDSTFLTLHPSSSFVRVLTRTLPARRSYRYQVVRLRLGDPTGCDLGLRVCFPLIPHILSLLEGSSLFLGTHSH